MSISVTQEGAKFRPVTIVIDDVRTASLLGHILKDFYDSTGANELTNYVDNLNFYVDSQYAIGEIKTLIDNIRLMCK